MVHVAGHSIPFREGESILTAYSYKYALPQFAALAAEAGLRVEQVWTDARHPFSVQYLTVRGS